MISIIVPAYNAEKTIERCILSVLAQTYKDFQLIIVNDGSTDTTANICEKYKDDSRLTIINQENKGEGGARNEGLLHCAGEYVVFLDSDDAMPEGTLEFYSRCNDADCVIGGYNRENEKGKKMLNIPDKEQILNNEEIVNAYLTRDMYVFMNGIQSKLFKSEIIKANNLAFDRLIVGADTNFLIKYYANCKSVKITREILYKVYVTPGSMSLRSIPDSWSAEVRNFETAVKEFKQDKNSCAAQILLMRAIKSTLIYSLRSGRKTFIKNSKTINDYIASNGITLKKEGLSRYERVITSMLVKAHYNLLYAVIKCRVTALNARLKLIG